MKGSALALFLFSMSLLLPSSAPQTVITTSTTTETTNIIDGGGIINTPYHNSTSPLFNIPFVRSFGRPLPIGRMCEQDSECANFSICRLVVQDNESTRKICECDSKVMKQVNGSCYVKPGQQCYFPNRNEHGYSFIPCLGGSICKNMTNKAAPRNGYCMCSSSSTKSEEQHRLWNSEVEMARCGANGMIAVVRNCFGLLVTLWHLR